MIERIRGFFFAARCVLCDEIAAEGTPFCEKCRGEVDKLNRAPCHLCGRQGVNCRCVPAALTAENVTAVHLFAYETDLSKRLIFLLKRKNIRALRAHFGKKLADRLGEVIPEEERGEFDITFAPRMARSVRLYGFDQAKDLCKAVSRRLDIPVVTVFAHTRGGEEQKTKTSAERTENAERSYRLARAGAGDKRGNMGARRGLILVDDVMTTGSTMKKLISLAREAGYERILCATVAKTSFLKN